MCLQSYQVNLEKPFQMFEHSLLLDASVEVKIRGLINRTETKCLNTEFRQWHLYCLRVVPCLYLGSPLSRLPSFVSKMIRTIGSGRLPDAHA